MVVTILDAYGNVVTGYTGKIRFTCTDHKAVLPSDYTFVSGHKGVHAFQVTLRSGGTQSLPAVDTLNGLLTGTEKVTVS
jgi:hypothetical protein